MWIIFLSLFKYYLFILIGEYKSFIYLGTNKVSDNVDKNHNETQHFISFEKIFELFIKMGNKPATPFIKLQPIYHSY